MALFWDRKEKPYVLLLFLMPLFWMVGSLFLGRYFPDPGEVLMSLSGIWASIAVIAILLVTPLVKYSSFKLVSRYRRFIGLSAFFYSLFHFIVYLILFTGLNVSWIISDLTDKPYIYAGVVSFIILSVLAVTSTKKMMKRLGKKWKPVHRLVYVVGLCIIAHLWWQVKSDVTIALSISAFIVPLLLLRFHQSQFYKKHFHKM